MKIKDTGRNILTGRRDKETRLWLVDIANYSKLANVTLTVANVHAPLNLTTNSETTVTQQNTLMANSDLARETMPERLAFLHAALGYLVPATFEDAIEHGQYASIPELTSARVRKCLKPSAATIKGHLDMARKNFRSTKPKKKCTTLISFPGVADSPQDMQPTKLGLERSNAVYAECFHITCQVYSDLSGPFLCASTSGMKYQMVVYDYDSNNILVESMMSRTEDEHTRAYKVIFSMDAGWGQLKLDSFFG